MKVLKRDAAPVAFRSGRVVRQFATLSCAAALVAGSLLSAQPALAEQAVEPSSPATAAAAANAGKGTTLTLEEERGEHGAYMGQSLAAQQPEQPSTDGQALRGALALAPRAGTWKAPGINGIDVSGWQPNVDWQRQWDMGARFAYVKSTEGDSFTSDTFSKQYIGAYNTGMIRGAYHFALPSTRNAVTQARFFVNNGGGWSPDGKTLPPLLDMEHNPYESLGNMCYDMSPSQLVNWIDDFSDTVKSMVGRTPMIYTTYAWWTHCTNNSTAFSDDHALHAAAYPYEGYQDNFNVLMYGGWKNYTVWQYSSTGPFAGDSNQWNGSYDDLKGFASQPQNPPISLFRDVNSKTLYQDEILWAAGAGISEGWPDGTFRPGIPVNRDAMAAFIYRLAGSPKFTAPAKSPFADYDADNMFYKEVTWLAQSGITTGWIEGNSREYRPFEPINRDAMAAFLYRLADLDDQDFEGPAESPFTDYNSDNLYYDEVTWLYSQGITTGWDDGTYRPFSPINRDAMVAFMKRYTERS